MVFQEKRKRDINCGQYAYAEDRICRICPCKPLRTLLRPCFVSIGPSINIEQT
nr:MAG TPA: hypothetical protein [Caudoviricetes sp.]